jgi:hypothetical protein
MTGFLQKTMCRESEFVSITEALHPDYQEPEPTPEEPLADILRRKVQADPKGWWIGHHFSFGMTMRNIMRQNGFGEKELEVDNLDDYYIPCIEEALPSAYSGRLPGTK